MTTKVGLKVIVVTISISQTHSSDAGNTIQIMDKIGDLIEQVKSVKKACASLTFRRKIEGF